MFDLWKRFTIYQTPFEIKSVFDLVMLASLLYAVLHNHHVDLLKSFDLDGIDSKVPNQEGVLAILLEMLVHFR